jgi:hypothetical protein
LAAGVVAGVVACPGRTGVTGNDNGEEAGCGYRVFDKEWRQCPKSRPGSTSRGEKTGDSGLKTRVSVKKSPRTAKNCLADDAKSA